MSNLPTLGSFVMMEKPDIDHIGGLSPAISIEQKSTSRNRVQLWELSLKSTTI